MFLGDTILGSYELSLLVKLLLAAIAGGLVGLERETHGRPAGIRTNILVALGACTMMIISEAFYLKYGGQGMDTALRIDPSRTAAQIITGIGFLGAGVIIKEGANVRGLTTAAGLWAVAGLGMAFGMGYLILGTLSTILIIFSLMFLKKLDPFIPKDRYLNLLVTGRNRKSLLEDLEKIFLDMNLRIANIGSNVDLDVDEVTFKLILTGHRKRIGKKLFEAVEQLEGLKKISYF